MKKRKIDLEDGRHGGQLGFPIGKILDIFYLQITQMLPTKFQVSWLFGSEEEAKNRFSRRPHGGQLGFLIETILAFFFFFFFFFFLIYESPLSFLPSFESIGAGA